MDITASYLQQWSAPQVSIFIGLFLVFLELLKTNKKLEEIKCESAKDSTCNPSDELDDGSK